MTYLYDNSLALQKYNLPIVYMYFVQISLFTLEPAY